MAARVHVFVALLTCLVVPLASWLDHGSLAYTMFASATWYRMEIVAVYADGSRVVIAPSDMAAQVKARDVGYFAGADHFRRVPTVTALRAHLHDIARLACSPTHPRRVEVTLFERDNDTAITTTTRERAECDR